MSLFPEKRYVDCWHKMPDGRFIIPNMDLHGKAYATTFKKVDGEYKLVLEELIVTLNKTEIPNKVKNENAASGTDARKSARPF